MNILYIRGGDTEHRYSMPVQVEFRLRTRRGPVQVSFIITDDNPMPGDDVDAGSQAPAATSTGANVLNRLLPKGSTALPQFSGDPDTRAQAAPFLLMVKRVFELSPELTNVHKLTALQSCFPINSPANAWFLQKLPELHTFAAFEAAFTERFGSSEIDLQLLRREFRDFAQEDSQSVTQFHMALSALATRISLSGAPLDNQYIAEQFRWGLKPNISAELFREQLRTKREYSLDELVKLAEDFERAEISRSRRRPGSGQPHLRAFDGSRYGKPDTGKWCVYHKTDSHDTDDCRTVQRLKREGKWRGRKDDQADEQETA